MVLWLHTRPVVNHFNKQLLVPTIHVDIQLPASMLEGIFYQVGNDLPEFDLVLANCCTTNTIGNGETELQQLSRFLPRGIAGILYWYILYPFHELIFGGMLSSIADKIGKPVVKVPQRFTPRLRNACAIPGTLKNNIS